jgi:hypothetical protein
VGVVQLVELGVGHLVDLDLDADLGQRDGSNRRLLVFGSPEER